MKGIDLAQDLRWFGVGALVLVSLLTFPANLDPSLPLNASWAFGGAAVAHTIWPLFGLGMLAYMVGLYPRLASVTPHYFVVSLVGFAVLALIGGWPFFTVDPREYILLGHALSLGLDPLKAPYGALSVMRHFPPMRYAVFPHLLDPYGPVFWVMARGLAVFPWQVGLWVWRMACAGAYVVGGFLLLKLTGKERIGLVALAWASPLVSCLLVQAAHNTVFALTFLFLEAFIVTQKADHPWAPAAAGGLAALSSGVTFLTLAPAAVLLLGFASRGWKKTLLSLGTAFAALTLSYTTYGPPWLALGNLFSSRGQLRQGFIGLRLVLETVFSAHLSFVLWAFAVAAAGVAIYVLSVRTAVEKRQGPRLLMTTGVVSLLPLVVTQNINAWYLIPALALGVGLGRTRWAWAFIPFMWYAGFGGYVLLGLQHPVSLIRVSTGAVAIALAGLLVHAILRRLGVLGRCEGA